MGASRAPWLLPTYIVAYTYVDLLTYAGPLQSWLRGAMGWKTPRDYWFPGSALDRWRASPSWRWSSILMSSSPRGRAFFGSRRASLKLRERSGATVVGHIPVCRTALGAAGDCCRCQPCHDGMPQ